MEVVKFDLIEETVEAGFGPLFDVWKKSRQLFEGINKAAGPKPRSGFAKRSPLRKALLAA